ncbi:MAG: divergent polysaccharide deacetylase family protein [Xanthobacteraceae bacterium]
MADDDLSTPLGQGKVRKRPKFKLTLAPIAAGGLGLMLAVVAGWAMFTDDPFGGEPMAVAPTNLRVGEDAQSGKPKKMAAADTEAADTEKVSSPSGGDGAKSDKSSASKKTGTKTVTIIDGQSGTRRDIEIPAAAELKSQPDEQQLSETSRHGPLPKVAQDGTRPAEAFARPVKGIPGKANAPRIAIVVGGLGIGAKGTAEALRKLPGAVTLAFAPYGGNLERHVAQARKRGHELLLQVPMEPFDYPDNDPGPHTLLTSLDAGQNIDRLHWLMSRFQGYVGLANYMGGRFTASEQALGPVLRETAKRGLIYLDDSASPRSLASQIAGANNLPFAKADVVIDAVPTRADVDRALGRLETVARAKGSVIGFTSALPVAIDRIARWAKGAESRGILLVPISAVVAKARQS